MYGSCEYCNTFAKLNRYRTCPACEQVNQDALARAREIIEKQGAKTVFELAETLAIPPATIFLWLDQSRISMGSIKYTCPACGKDMLNGVCDCVDLLVEEEEEEENHPLFPERFYSTLRLDKIRRRYWDRISRIRKKQRRDIWVST
ncbi:MAG: hypothetical protein C4527_00850 [Candidatus Omnitrophota bacterium]|jgi:hypothetical protein|nr:MAG: hypothetical protein C4527_00850 [Candidatus Omnitrophota bacterium]